MKITMIALYIQLSEILISITVLQSHLTKFFQCGKWRCCRKRAREVLKSNENKELRNGNCDNVEENSILEDREAKSGG